MRGFLLLLLYLVTAPGQAQVFDRLYDDSPQPALSQPLQWLAAPRGTVASPDAFAGPGEWNFQPYKADTVLPTSEGQEVWARFSLPATAVAQAWFVRVPRHTVLKVTLYARDARGLWRAESAGEAIPPAQWALRTRVPSFELQTGIQAETGYYLRFEHRNPITERPMLLSAVDYVDGSSRVGVVIGLMWGLFGLMAMLSVGAFALTRNRTFLWFGSFVLSLMCTQLILIGYGGWRIWPHSVYLNQVMGWVSASLATASAAWFCAKATYAHDSYPHVFRLLATVAIGSLLMACLMLVAPELLPRPLRNLWLAGSTVAMLAALVWLGLRGRSWNLLLLAGAVPIGLGSLLRLSYNAGWVMHIEKAQTAGVFTALAGLLWIFLVLAWRSRDALLSSERAAALAAYDPATGLMLPYIVDIRLPQMLLRASRLKPGCGVLMLRWLEHGQTLGVLNHEKHMACLASIGAILRGASRDVDTVVRYSQSEFMMLVEGPITRNALADISTHILAACIRFSLKSADHAFNLHIAIWHGGPGMHVTQSLIDLLRDRLQQMSAGTRRPVQFVDAASEPTDFRAGDADRRKRELLEMIDALETADHPAPANDSRPAVTTVRSPASS
ncbi:MAG: hypothetical protein JWQ72_1738 [Polaromonas sp.]|nr:hypothetical protein [Polaromonas sp.]